MGLALSDQAQELAPLLSAALSALGLTAEPEAQRRVLAYVSLLQRWNAVHNLSSARDGAELLQQHVIDCLAIVGPLRRHARDRSLMVLDAGTGGGLPAVVVAVMQPTWDVTAVDAVEKKIAFLRQVSGELGLANLRPRHARLETLLPTDGRFDVVTSRAFSSLRQFVATTKHVIEPTGTWLAMKGKPPEAEIRDLPTDCQLFHVEPLAVPGLDAERCLVWMKPTNGPRKP
jgi:16S rRNA (guanine527-N7)-methyltransferase